MQILHAGVLVATHASGCVPTSRPTAPGQPQRPRKNSPIGNYYRNLTADRDAIPEDGGWRRSSASMSSGHSTLAAPVGVGTGWRSAARAKILAGPVGVGAPARPITTSPGCAICAWLRLGGHKLYGHIKRHQWTIMLRTRGASRITLCCLLSRTLVMPGMCVLIRRARKDRSLLRHSIRPATWARMLYET